MALAALPPTKDVKEVLEILLGRPVDLQDAEPWAPPPGVAMIAAEFHDDTDRLAATAVVDVPLGVFLAAAIGLLPPGGAQDMAEDGELTAMLAENLYEVLDVTSSVFNRPGAPHVRLTQMHGPGDPPPREIVSWLSSPVGRLDLDVDVSGYGSGVLVLATGP